MAPPPPGRQQPATDDDAAVVSGLVQASFLVQAVLGEVAERHQLTVAQARLLVVLSDREPTMLVLAGIMGLEKSSLTGLVQRAEGRGLVERFTPDGDRRSVRVRLTRDGRRRGAAYGTDARAVVRRLLAALPDADRRRLARLTEQIVAGYAAAHGIDRSTFDAPGRLAGSP